MGSEDSEEKKPIDEKIEEDCFEYATQVCGLDPVDKVEESDGYETDTSSVDLIASSQDHENLRSQANLIKPPSLTTIQENVANKKIERKIKSPSKYREEVELEEHIDLIPNDLIPESQPVVFEKGAKEYQTQGSEELLGSTQCLMDPFESDVEGTMGPNFLKISVS